jgi:predicted MFS family arabinose efflux permease
MMQQRNPPWTERSVAYRNIALLTASMATVGSNQAVVVSAAALAAIALAPDPALATLPMTATILGLALSALPATRIIHGLGRRKGLMLGAAVGIAGGTVAAYAVVLGSFWLFCAALFFVGTSAAFVQQYRFAIADSVSESLRARAISLVLLGGVAAGVIGPQTALFGKDLFAGAEFAGSFLGIVALSAVGFVVLSFTRLAPERHPEPGEAAGRTTAELLRSPMIFVPIGTAMISYALMTFVMVAAPLAMVTICGHSTAEATGAIQWHIVAMFLPSLVTGWVISRIGAPATIALGLLLIAGCAFVNLNGISVLHFSVALVMLGVGWNFGFIGSTTMLTGAYAPEEAQRAQSLNEPLVFGAMAVASIGSGILLQTIGWQSINVMAFPIVLVGLALLGWCVMRGRRAPA